MLGAVMVLALCELPFECVKDLQLRNATVSWQLATDLKDEAYQGIYRTGWWRIRHVFAGEVERKALLVRPDGGKPFYRVFERVRVRNWRTLRLGHRRVWHEILPTDEVRSVSVHLELLRVLVVADQLRKGAPPTSLAF